MTETMRSWPTWPIIPSDACDAVQAVLASGKINYHTGHYARDFEKAFAQYLDVPFALAVSNGTLALELALHAAGIGSGDEVIVPSRTFIATAGAVVNVGATPVVADIDAATDILTPLTVAHVLTPRTRAVIPVHLGGYPVDIEALKALTDQLDLVIIEDCAQAHGAQVRGRKVGALGDMGCFSFCQDKILPLGEGGMVTFKDRALYEKAWAYRDHGRSFEKAHDATVGAASAQFKWLNDSFGTNARMGEMEGALGGVLLRHLDEYHQARTENARALRDALSSIEGMTWAIPDAEQEMLGTEHAFYRAYAHINLDALAPGWTRDRIIEEILKAGVPLQYGSCALIAHEAAFAQFPQQPGAPWSGALKAHESSIAFYVHPSLTPDDMRAQAALMRPILKEALNGAS